MSKTKSIIAAALSGALLLPTISVAEAGPYHRGHGGGYHGHHHQPKPHVKKRDNTGAAVAAGIIGLAAGAIILGATSQASRPAPVYVPPAPPRGPAYPAQVGYQPWSPAWYQYCSAKYRSFNPQTGTFTTYQGVQKFCQ